MLNFIKEAAYIIKFLEENLNSIENAPVILEELTEKVETLNKKIDKLDNLIQEKETQLSQVNSTLQKYEGFFAKWDKKIHEIIQKENEVEEKRRAAEQQRRKEGELQKEQRIIEVIDKYAAALSDYHFSYLLVPTVIDFLVEHIEKGVRFFNRESQYNHFYYEAERDYPHKISDFFSTLTRNDIKVKGNEGFYLKMLRERILEKNYEELYKKHEFYLMNNAENLEEAVYYFLYVKGEGDIITKDEEYLAFLHYYLLKHGYGNQEDAIFFKGGLIAAVKEKYTEIEQRLKQRERARIEGELFKLRQDKSLTDLLDKFIRTYDCFALTLPTVIEYVMRELPESQWKGETAQFGQLAKSFKDELANFLLILENKGYKKPHRNILERMKELILKKNYDDFKENFYPLINRDYSNISHAIYDYIEIVGKSKYNILKYLGFLSLFFFEKGFTPEIEDALAINKRIEKEFERFDVIQLEKELMKQMQTGDTVEAVIDEKTGAITMDDIGSMTAAEFEEILCRILNNLGFVSRVANKAGSKGVDLIAERQGRKYVIHAKRYQGNVGKRAIQDVLNGMKNEGADVAWVITNSSFTSAARELAEDTDTVLWDKEKLETMLELAQI